MKKTIYLLLLLSLNFQYINAFESPASFLNLKNHVELDYYIDIFSKHNYHTSGDTLYVWDGQKNDKEFWITSAEHTDYNVILYFTPMSKLVYNAHIRGVTSKHLFVSELLSFYIDLTHIYGQPDSACYIPEDRVHSDIEYFSFDMIGKDSINIKTFFEQAKPFIFIWTNGLYRVELTIEKKYSSYIIPDFICTINNKKVYDKYVSEMATIEEERQVTEKRHFIDLVLITIMGLVALFFLGRYFYNVYKKDKAKQKAINESRAKKQEEIDNMHKVFIKKLIDKYGTVTRVIPNTYHDRNRFKHYDDIIVFEKPKKIIIDKKEYDFSDILSCSMFDNNHKNLPPIQVTRTSTSSMLGRAAVGGLTLGVAGAVVGAMTAKKESSTSLNSNNIASYILTIGVKSIENPIINLNFGFNKSKAEDVYGLIQAIIAMNE